MISHELKCIFIHIPRCGGTSVETWLVGQDWELVDPKTKHLLASQAKRLYAPYWPRYFKFAIVRNPFTRFASCVASYPDFYGLKAERGTEIDFTGYRKRFGTDIVLEFDYRYAVLPDVASPMHEPGSIYGNLLDEPLDFIAHYENIQADMQYVREVLGLNEPFAHRVEGSASENVLLIEADRAIVKSLYEKDFARFGYSPAFENRYAMPNPVAGTPKRVVRTAGERVEPLKDLPALLMRANTALRQGRFQDAENLLAEAEAIDSNSLWRLELLAAVFQATGKRKEVVACFKRILRLNPQQPFAYVNLALVLWETNRRWDALVQLERALDEWPRFARAIELYARFRNELQAQSPALARLQRAKRYITASYKVRGALKALRRIFRQTKARIGFLNRESKQTVS